MDLCRSMQITLHSPLETAASLLAQEAVVAIPTETVYGLAGNMYSRIAVEKIFSLKQRPLSNPLIVHIADFDRAHEIVTDIPERLYILAKKYWPGPLTLLLPKKKSVPDLITAGSDKVAIRVPLHPVTHALLRSLDFPLVAPSANPYTRISPTTAEHVQTYFGSKLPFILDGGPCEVGLESTIVGMDGNSVIVYRQGAIAKHEIEEMIGETVALYHSNDHKTPTPGLAPRHYAPKTTTLLCEREQIIELYTERSAVMVFAEPIKGIPLKNQYVLSPDGLLPQAAHNLYRLLHTMDKEGFEKIICERFPEEGLGCTMNDRLTRAGSK